MNKEQNDLGVAASEQAAGLSVASPQPKTASGLSTSIPNAKERPILFSAPMVRAILDGSKTQTRRIVKPQIVNVSGSTPWEWKGTRPKAQTNSGWIASTHLEELLSWLKYSCPYGKVGDRLWVRETWQELDWPPTGPRIVYRADNDADPAKWRPSIFMPRAMSRINLEVVNVRVEQLQDISEDDALAEGAGWETTGDTPQALDRLARMTGITDPGSNLSTRRAHYALLWESINGSGSWDANPWVWVVEFRVRDSSENPRPQGEIVADSPTVGSATGTPKETK